MFYVLFLETLLSAKIAGQSYLAHEALRNLVQVKLYLLCIGQAEQIPASRNALSASPDGVSPNRAENLDDLLVL